MNKIGFDFNKYIDLNFKSMTTAFLPFHICLDVLMAYLVEGVKVLYRYTYAIMKCHKQFIKKLNEPEEFLDFLKAEAKTNTNQ